MGGESIKPIRKRIHVYFLMTTYSASYDSIESSQNINEYHKHDLRLISVSEIEQNNTFTRIAV